MIDSLPEKKSIDYMLPATLLAMALGGAYLGRKQLAGGLHNLSSNVEHTPLGKVLSSVGLGASVVGPWLLGKSMDKAIPAGQVAANAAFNDRMAARYPTTAVNAAGAKVTKPTQSHYDQMRNKVVTAPGVHPGILAHELGHYERGAKKAWGLNVGPKIVGGGLGLWGALAKDEDTALAASASASALGGVTLYDELAASRRGSQILQAVDRTGLSGHSRISKMSPYRGAPSYAAGALAPLLLHATRKAFGAFDPAPTP